MTNCRVEENLEKMDPQLESFWINRLCQRCLWSLVARHETYQQLYINSRSFSLLELWDVNINLCRSPVCVSWCVVLKSQSSIYNYFSSKDMVPSRTLFCRLYTFSRWDVSRDPQFPSSTCQRSVFLIFLCTLFWIIPCSVLHSDLDCSVLLGHAHWKSMY